jgi:hypothetical protein
VRFSVLYSVTPDTCLERKEEINKCETAGKGIKGIRNRKKVRKTRLGPVLRALSPDTGLRFVYEAQQ